MPNYIIFFIYRHSKTIMCIITLSLTWQYLISLAWPYVLVDVISSDHSLNTENGRHFSQVSKPTCRDVTNPCPCPRKNLNHKDFFSSLLALKFQLTKITRYMVLRIFINALISMFDVV